MTNQTNSKHKTFEQLAAYGQASWELSGLSQGEMRMIADHLVRCGEPTEAEMDYLVRRFRRDDAPAITKLSLAVEHYKLVQDQAAQASDEERALKRLADQLSDHKVDCAYRPRDLQTALERAHQEALLAHLQCYRSRQKLELLVQRLAAMVRA